jgi:hypothetical protein
LSTVFFASIEDKRITRGPELISVEEFKEIRATLGDAPLFAVGSIPGGDGLQIERPAAEFLIGCRASFVPAIEPLYLKEPHITMKRKA